MKDPNDSRHKLALFDFDGTLTTRDSFMQFLKYTHGITGLALHFLYLWPVLALYKLRLLSNANAKRIVFTRFYRNYPLTFFREKAAGFCNEVLPEILKPEAINKMRWHQQQGHKVIIVTAMFELVIQNWCEANNIALLATELEITHDRFSGAFSTPNCYGAEKAERVRKAGLLRSNPYIYAYGDSKGDKELLALADKAYYRRF